jgi:type III secretion system YscI/HrpB-like protein
MRTYDVRGVYARRISLAFLCRVKILSARCNCIADANRNNESIFLATFLWRLIMAAVNFTDVATQAATPRIGRLDASDSVGQRFSAAMEKAGTDSAIVGSQQVDAASRVPSAGQTIAAGATADAQDRARRALNLNPVNAVQRKPAHGDAILNGLQHLRGVFDAQEARINGLTSRTAVDTNALLMAQWEVTKLSVLVDMTSKLAGKFAQLGETLLKGQ